MSQHDHDEGGCTCGCPVPDCAPCGGFKPAPELSESERNQVAAFGLDIPTDPALDTGCDGCQ